MTSCAAAAGSGVFGLLDERPQNHMAIPPTRRTAAAPMAMPAMAPGPNSGLLDAAAAVVAAGAGEAVELAVGLALVDDVATPLGMDPSLGQSSPGTSVKVLASASCLWCAKLVLALGFMTPTIPYVVQLPGAPQ